MTINQLLQFTISKRASDLHLVVGMPPIVRIDGVLFSVPGENVLTNDDVGKMVGWVLNSPQKQLFETNKELDLSFQLEGHARFRVNAYHQRGGPAASFRLIPMTIPGMEELGLPKMMKDLTRLKQGFILVTGPTGQGKSTTLAAVLEEINKTRPVHIVTIEDPIEYVYSAGKAVVSQREVHADTLSWAMALKSILREDPDVVLIGEMRDLETISSALTIAETGHLVFATLHTNSAAQTVDRIVDVFPENQQPQIKLQLSANLEAVFSQRLIPKVGGGRQLASEIMLGTGAVKAAIREGRTHMLDNIIMTSAEYGMVTLDSALADLVRQGVIAKEVAMQYSIRPDDFARNLERGGRK